MQGKKNLLKNSIMLYIMTALKYILPFIIVAKLTRCLGTEAYGLITYINAVMSYFLLLCEFGFNYSATRRIALCKADNAAVNAVIAEVMTAKLLLAALGFVIMALMCLFTPTIRENFGLFTLFYLAIPAVSIFVPDFVYRGLEKMEYVTFRYAVGKLLSVVMIFALVKSERDIVWVPVSYLVSTAFAAWLSLAHLKNSLHLELRFAPVKEAMAEMKSSFSCFTSIFATLAFSALNTLVMDYTGFTKTDIACWGIALQLISAIQSLYEPITSSIYPYIAAKKNYRIAVRLTLILSLPVIAGCTAAYYLSDFAVGVVAGAGYTAAGEIFRWLIPVLLFSFLAQMLGFPVLGAAGRQNYITVSTLTAAAVQIAGLAALALCGRMTVFNICLIRCAAEAVMFVLRAAFSAAVLKKLPADGAADK